MQITFLFIAYYLPLIFSSSQEFWTMSEFQPVYGKISNIKLRTFKNLKLMLKYNNTSKFDVILLGVFLCHVSYDSRRASK